KVAARSLGVPLYRGHDGIRAHLRELIALMDSPPPRPDPFQLVRSPPMHDVIVIGLGAMGSSAALHLARRGLSVLGMEQFGIPHDRGSSHGGSRMIRLCYAEHPDFVPLLRRSYELWHELEEASARRL